MVHCLMTYLVPKDLLKLNNAINTCSVRQHYFPFLIIKFLWMFNMPHLSIQLYSTEKWYIFSFKDTSVDSVALN